MKAPYLPLVVLGWAVHGILLILSARAARVLKTESISRNVSLPYGKALKDAYWKVNNLNQPLLKESLLSPFDKISSDSHRIILSFLDSNSLAKSERVDRQWYSLATSNIFWNKFPYVRKYVRTVVNLRWSFYNILMALIMLICIAELAIQYSIFIIRIQDNLPVGLSPVGAPCATKESCIYNRCKNNVCEDFPGEVKCLADGTLSKNATECCSNGICDETDSDGDSTGRTLCCSRARVWRSYSCWSMAFSYSFNIVSTITATLIINDHHAHTGSVGIFVFGLITLLLAGPYLMAISVFVTHVIPAFFVYIWISICFVVIFMFPYMMYRKYIKRGYGAMPHAWVLGLRYLFVVLVFQPVIVMLVPMIEYIFLGASYTDAIATVWGELSTMDELSDDFLVYVL